MEVYALAEEGHIFDGWEGDGVEEVNESSTFIIMTKDRSVLAKFKPLTYEVSITSSLGGRVEGAGTYTFGESIQLSAIPDPENQFLGWIINGEDWGEKLTLEVPASENLWVAARFSHTKPVVELTSSSGGYTVGDGNYEPGENVHIQAIPNSGYVFTKWTGIGAVDETLPSVTLILTENLSVHAEFLEQPPNTFSLAIESIPSQGGYHKGTGAYGSGERVPISASPLPGYTFEQWTGSGVLNPLDSNTSVLLTENTRLEAKFAPIRYQLTMKDAVGGVALGAGNYPNGTEVNLSAIPQTGYKFIRWNGEGITNLYDSSTTLKIEANVSIEPIFEAQKYFLQTESSKGGIALGQGYYEYGQKVEITAVPSTGYKFTGWQGEGISQADLLATTIHITSDITAKAQFAIIDNYFTPYANDFSLYIDHLDFEKRETLHTLPLQDGDGDLIKYSLFSGNIDKDSDGEPFILVESNGSIVILDPEEIIDLAGTSLSLIISLDDQKGKASSVSGLIRIADKYILESAPLGDGWFESPWFGHFLKPNDSWIYHLKLGWIYIYPLQTSGYWLWDPVLEEWLWTDSTFFPWTFSNKISGWIYFSLDSEKVRFFNHNSQEWLFR